MAILKKIFLLSGIFLLFSPLFTKAQSRYVKKYRPVADSLAKVYGIPAALILGVAIIESGSGKSRNAKLLNNHFGIIGKNHLKRPGHAKNPYKQYKNITFSYIQFAEHLTKRKFYRKLKGNMNYVLWVNAMGKDKYSQNPVVWKRRIISTIKKNGLDSAR